MIHANSRILSAKEWEMEQPDGKVLGYASNGSYHGLESILIGRGN